MVSASLEGHPTSISGHLLWGDLMGNMVRLMNSMSRGPLFHSICCKISSLIRSKAVWNNEIEIVCLPMAVGLGRSTVNREGKSAPRECVCASESKALFLPWWKWSHIITLPRWDAWPPGRGRQKGLNTDLCYWRVLLSAGTYSRSQRLDLLREWKLSGPCCWVHEYPLYWIQWPLFSLSHWTKRGVVARRKMAPKELVRWPICLLCCFSAKTSLWWAFACNHILFPFREFCSHPSSLGFLGFSFLIMILLPLYPWPNCWSLHTDSCRLFVWPGPLLGE